MNRMIHTTVEPPPKEFFERLSEFYRAGSEVPLAALIYALVDIHRTPPETGFSDAEETQLPSVLDLLYGSVKRNQAIFARPDILKLVLDKYEKEHRPNWWEFKVWRAYADLASHMDTFRNGKTPPGEELKKALGALVTLLETRGNYPHIKPPQADTIRAFYGLIKLAVEAKGIRPFLANVEESDWQFETHFEEYNLKLEDAVSFLRHCQHKLSDQLRRMKNSKDKPLRVPEIVYPLEKALLEIVFEYATSG